MATKVEVDVLTDRDIYYAQESLITPFEFPLIEYLHRNHRGVLNRTKFL
jgi:hypothetical protein